MDLEERCIYMTIVIPPPAVEVDKAGSPAYVIRWIRTISGVGLLEGKNIFAQNTGWNTNFNQEDKEAYDIACAERDIVKQRCATEPTTIVFPEPFTRKECHDALHNFHDALTFSFSTKK